jgi:hypothetical protein
MAVEFAIQGDPYRWEVIKNILVEFGATKDKDNSDKTCDDRNSIYYIGGWSNNKICVEDLSWRRRKSYIIYTLDEFNREIKFRSGDKVYWTDTPCTIVGYSCHEDRLCYTAETPHGMIWGFPEAFSLFKRSSVSERCFEKLKYDSIESYLNTTSIPTIKTPTHIDVYDDESIHITIPNGYKVVMEFSKGEIILKKIQK